ncbi:MAG: T9SS type A sorting domain-containing protein [Paludibacter sp.]
MIKLRFLLFFFLINLIISSVSALDFVQIQVKSSYTAGWGYNNTKIVSMISNYKSVTDGTDDFTRYGTYKYIRTDSTGFFYVKKIDGRWWMIDPNGYAGINMGVASMNSGSIQNDYDRIKNIGFNGVGNFIGNETQTKTGYNVQNYNLFSYTRALNFFLGYKNVRKNYYSNTPSTVDGSLDYVLVFDPKFTTYCDDQAKANALPFVNDRDMLGYFTDNEINFNQDQLQNLVRDLPAGDPSRDSALVFATSRGLTEADCINYTSKVTEQMKQDFATQMANHYYRTITAAIHKYDPNHLILGSRLNGRPRAIPGVVAASEKYMDVTSVNFYDKFTPNEQIAYSQWTNDKPCIVGEFYIKDINIFSATQPGAGWYVNNQASRGDFYQNTCIELLKSKCFIGWQYFKYQDDSDSNKGIVNGSGVEYTDMTALMSELNKQVYHMCDFYDSKSRRPNYNTKVRTLTASQDTYVVPGSTNTTNYGTATELEVRNYTLESYRREAFFKFDLSSYKDSLKFLKHAELDLTCTTSDASVRSIFLTGLTDNSWNELTLTGTLRNANTDWSTGYNRLGYIKSAVSTGLQTFDVTNWITDKTKNGIVSFKIMDLTNTTAAIKIASHRYSDTTKQPKLVLTFYDTTSTGIDQIRNTSENRLSCNPATNQVTILGDDIKEVELLNLNGQLVYKSSEPVINLSPFSKGLYIVRISTTSGKNIINKLVIK